MVGLLWTYRRLVVICDNWLTHAEVACCFAVFQPIQSTITQAGQVINSINENAHESPYMRCKIKCLKLHDNQATMSGNASIASASLISQSNAHNNNFPAIADIICLERVAAAGNSDETFLALRCPLKSLF